MVTWYSVFKPRITSVCPWHPFLSLKRSSAEYQLVDLHEVLYTSLSGSCSVIFTMFQKSNLFKWSMIAYCTLKCIFKALVRTFWFTLLKWIGWDRQLCCPWVIPYQLDQSPSLTPSDFLQILHNLLSTLESNTCKILVTYLK